MMPVIVGAAALASMQAEPARRCHTASQVLEAAILRNGREDVPADVGLSLQAPGLTRASWLEVEWPEWCEFHLKGVSAYGLQLNDGSALTATGDRLRSSKATLTTSHDGPPAPSLPNSRFLFSTGIMVQDWRVGAWRRGDGSISLAGSRPGRRGVRPLLTSQDPVGDIRHLPAPDARGGTLSIVQLLGPRRFHFVRLGWTEQGLDSSSRH